MLEILIIAILLFTVFALFIYISIKTKDLNIKILDNEQIKETLSNEMNRRISEKEELEELSDSFKEEIIRLEECIKIKNKAMKDSFQMHHAIVEQKDKQNATLEKRCTELESTMESAVKEAAKEARADSIKRQRSILKGQATEHLAPYINSDYNPKDYKFIGDPIDYIIYDGLSEIKTKEDSLNRIIFMDIKTGKSQLNRTQRAVKKCIEEGKIEFEIYRPDKKELKGETDV